MKLTFAALLPLLLCVSGKEQLGEQFLTAGRRRAFSDYKGTAYNFGSTTWPCPTGDTFIKEVILNSIPKTYNSVTKSFNMNAFMVNSQPTSIHDLKSGYELNKPYDGVTETLSDAARSYYVKTSSGSSWQELNKASAQQVPSAYTVLLYHHKMASMYAEGFFKHTPAANYQDDPDLHQIYQDRNNWGLYGDEEKRMFWKLSDHSDGSKCYAMSTYREVNERPADDFGGTTDEDNTLDYTVPGVYKVSMRLLKFTVCKGNECQSKRLVIDCWVAMTEGSIDQGNQWVQCDEHENQAAIAGILSLNA